MEVSLLDLLTRPEKDEVRLVGVHLKLIAAHPFVKLGDVRHHD